MSTKLPCTLRLVCLAAALCTSAPVAAVSQYAGVYLGTFSSPDDSGQFAFMLRENDVGVVIAFDTVDETGFVKDGIAVAADGSFSFTTPFGETVVGGLTPNGVGGAFDATFGTGGTFQGSRSASDGFFADHAGYYPNGTLSATTFLNGSPVGSVTATTFALIVGADGNGFGLLRTEDTYFGEISDDGFSIQVDPNDTFVLSLILDNIHFDGVFAVPTRTLSASFSVSDGPIEQSGTFSISRGEPLPLPDVDNDGVGPQTDNCPDVANPQQTDTDGDGQGDACDDDDDDDGLSDAEEQALGTDPLKRDTDGDGVDDGDEVQQGRNPRVHEGAFVIYVVLPALDD